MKKILRTLLVLFMVLILVIFVKTYTFRSVQWNVEPVDPPVLRMESASNLSRAITFPTISYDIGLPVDTSAFEGFHQFLAEAYPIVHSKLKKEVFSEFSLLYTWEGQNPALKPVVLMSHMDVVPAIDTDAWERPPFSGENDGTFIWGRGTLDDKGQLIAILEAVEKLAGEQYVPDRTVYLAFGHDEEIGGELGARVIANSLRDRGVEAEFVLDEGLFITQGIIPLIDMPVASVGISEKGYLSLSLSVEMDGGHSAYPEKETAITVLNEALCKIAKKPMKADITGPVRDFIRYTGPEMPILPRAIFANTWLFKRIILSIYESSNTGNASVRTTSAPTIIQAGIKDNVIPTRAEAILNFRIIPGETSDDVLKHMEKVISDERIQISVIPGHQEPSPVSPLHSAGFDVIHRTIKQIYPDVMVNPILAIGQTDIRHFASVSGNLYRFFPARLTRDDLTRIHGLDERISLEDYGKAIGFYYQLIKNLE